ncbi:putative sulfate exporter family transporter [Leptospira sp. 96542]|nr:putative sulfate exporter family transporter [Leptospira sp. 96542]
MSCAQKLLRLGIVLFGLRLSFQDIAAVGWVGVLADAGVLLSTFALALWLGRRWLKLDSQTALLIGAGSAICGAAAVLATEPVVKAPAAKVAIAVATVVVFGTLAMFLYPVLYALQRHLDVPGVGAWAFGIYTGSTVHEVAQVAAVGNAIGPDAAKSAVIAKMMRVLMLAPFLLGLSWMMARGEKTERGGKQGGVTVLPWFVLGFVLMAGLRSLDLAWPWMPPAVLQALLWLGNLLLATAMAALGLSTHASVIHRAGGKPLLLGALLFAWLLVGGALLNAVVHALLG